jgi:hypothetical protein
MGLILNLEICYPGEVLDEFPLTLETKSRTAVHYKRHERHLTNTFIYNIYFIAESVLFVIMLALNIIWNVRRKSLLKYAYIVRRSSISNSVSMVKYI